MHRALTVTALLFCAGNAFAQNCAVPEALLAAGFVDEAKTAYAAILTGDPKAEPPRPTADERACAITGLRDASAMAYATKLAAGDLYRTAGDAEKAAAEYNGALQLVPASAAVARGVTLMQPVPAVERARNLARLGLDTQALAVVDESVTTKKDSREQLPEDLAYLYGPAVPYWDKAQRIVTAWWPPIAAVIAGFVVLLVAWRLGRGVVAALRRSLHIEDFDKGGLAEEHSGKQFAAAVRSQLHVTAAGSKRGRIDLVTGPIESVQPPAEVEAIVPPASATWLSPVTWVKAIPALFLWLIPSGTMKLNGYLHSSDGKRGVGVTAHLVDRQKIAHSYTFWQEDFDDKKEPSEAEEEQAVDRLAEYVAIWLLFHTSKKLSMLGTDDWKSYALFRAGVFAEADERPSAAKRLYVRALQLDSRLRGARFNLAQCLWREKDYAAATEQYVRVRDEAKDNDRDPTLYSALYNIAVGEYNNKETTVAAELMVKLEKKIDETLRRSDSWLRGNPALRAHLTKIRPAVRAALATMMAELGDTSVLKALEKELKASDVSPMLHGNLACAYAVAAQKATVPADATRYTNLSFDCLERAFKLEAKYAVWALDDDDPDLACIRTLDLKRLKKLAEKYPTEKTTLGDKRPDRPLAKFNMIGSTYAKELGSNKIDTPAKLLQKTLRAADRQTLATMLSVTATLVTKWAHAMDLSRIVGMKPGHVNLLVLAGVGSLDELKGESAADLADVLTALGTATDETDVPDAATVQTWVDDARTNTRPKVR